MINTRTNNDMANTVVLAVPVLIVGFLVYRWFGFEFILGNGPALIGLALFTLALAATEIGDHQPGLLHQRIRLAKGGCTAIGQPIIGPSGTTLLGNAVRVGERQQAAEPARVIRIGHRLAGRATQVGTELPRQLASTLHAATSATRCLVVTGQQGEAAVQVGTATFRDPRAPWRILDELRGWCEAEGVQRLDELVGVARRRD